MESREWRSCGLFPFPASLPKGNILNSSDILQESGLCCVWAPMHTCTCRIFLSERWSLYSVGKRPCVWKLDGFIPGVCQRWITWWAHCGSWASMGVMQSCASYWQVAINVASWAKLGQESAFNSSFPDCQEIKGSAPRLCLPLSPSGSMKLLKDQRWQLRPLWSWVMMLLVKPGVWGACSIKGCLLPPRLWGV